MQIEWALARLRNQAPPSKNWQRPANNQMGGSACKPVQDYAACQRLLTQSDIDDATAQFMALAKAKGGSIPKDAFIRTYFAPR